ncbi:iron-siderophore ABC transporter substrate-binding protein [Brachybacterium alimentarium]|uniref:iron-siderophore ABC transporter substrate-binding protein n=1 Tax=Brachybacterium alimentarium TaxID=47845 RepID=UPI000DF14F39|nr:iron-siderophore ABC transporter substrate-binding protein [Brachybacterium alimentarium]RCS86119.1 iron-siderophore ABC transporter substrate-binding protein [Brachybacterium alimentarium]
MPVTARFTRRAWITGALAAPLALAACSGGADGAGSSASDGEGTGDFTPVTIEHALGTAEITEKPQRIVTLGQGSAETAIALGIIPVGVEEYPWGADDSGYLPWIHEAVTEAGGELPEQFTGATELDVEAVLALEPDVILAPWSGVTQEQFDILTDIAPTVAYAEQPWVITWEEQITTIGKALGEDDAAKGLINEIHETFEKSAQPGYADHTFSFVYNSGPGTLGVFYQDEQRVAMVRALGLTVDPVNQELGEWDVPGTDSAMIGLENADKLSDSDLIFTFYSDEKNREETEAQDLYAAIPAVEHGAIVAPTDQSFVTGSSIINPLTVPWALERYIPMIDDAITKVPAS